IDQEAEHPERENERNHPLRHGRSVARRPVRDAKDDGERDLEQDERELDPEADAQDAVLTVLGAQPLELSAEEDGADDVPHDEDREEGVVHARVVRRVEDAEADQADSADERGEDGEPGEHLFDDRRVADEGAFVPQPAVRSKGGVEEDGCDAGAGDEEGFQLGGADVGDVGD
ncbi:MAG: hypothetical protein LQ340_007353, partial [Diploschistes diacapsis]